MNSTRLTIGQCATLGCLLEVTAPKPGNVHRGADFEDLTFDDFAVSAVAIAPAMQTAHETGVGQAVLTAIRATRELVQTNTNLGTVLLIAPLAAVSPSESCEEGIRRVLAGLTEHDAEMVYEAINLASPAGLGKVDDMDIADAPPSDLLAAMRAAADRDLVARQYMNGFEQVLRVVVPKLQRGRSLGWSLTDTIVHTHVHLMSDYPDSFIARKCGAVTAAKSAALAGRALDAGEPGDEGYQRALSDLDFWLRGDGNQRNPGTTADLIAAGLFAALRDQIVEPPFR